MARIPVTEAGFYNGQFVQAGGNYDDGKPVGDAADAKASPSKKVKAKNAPMADKG